MKQLVQFIATSIVSLPKLVEVTEKKNNQTGFREIWLSVAPQDMGKIIGKQGRIIKAIRDLIKVKAIIKKEKVFLYLKED